MNVILLSPTNVHRLYCMFLYTIFFVSIVYHILQIFWLNICALFTLPSQTPVVSDSELDLHVE